MTRRPTREEIDRRTTRAVDAFCEVHGRSPGGPPPDYEGAADEVDAWALTPEGQRVLKAKGIKPWWPWSTMP